MDTNALPSAELEALVARLVDERVTARVNERLQDVEVALAALKAHGQPAAACKSCPGKNKGNVTATKPAPERTQRVFIWGNQWCSKV